MPVLNNPEPDLCNEKSLLNRKSSKYFYMNILLLTHSYPDETKIWRGSFIREQAIALSLNHRVTVVVFKIDYDRFAPFAGCSVSKREEGNLTEYTVITCRSFPVINQFNYLFRTYRFIRNNILRNTEFDLIHSHLSYPAGFLCTVLQKRTNIPGFITEHSRIKSYFRSRIHEKCVLYAIRNTNCIIAVSDSLKTEIFSFVRREISVIPNIVDTTRFGPAVSGTPTTLNIGFLGGLGNNNKGLDLLLKSAARIDSMNYRLHIGGDGVLMKDYRDMAKELGISDNCIFYGTISPEKIPFFYSQLDFFILASRYETFGVVLIEAMAAGIPVIATKCGGPEGIVTPETGLLIEKENIDALVKAIKTMSESLPLYDREKIKNLARENFGQNAFIDRQNKLYNDILRII